MKFRSVLLAVSAVLALSFSSFGSITNVDLASDGDGAIDCYVYTYGQPLTSVDIDGVQYWGPGHIVGTILTDSELDPTLTLNNTIDNDTGVAWAAYQVNIYMNKPFTIPSVPLLNAPPGWSLNSYTPVAFSTGTNYMATIYYDGAPPIPDFSTGSIDFTYSVQFTGSVTFTEELIPIAVPEPCALSLVFGGGLMLAARRLSRRQAS